MTKEECTTKAGRRVVTISVAGVANNASTQCNWITTAACEDGSIWGLRDNDAEWCELPPIPPPPWRIYPHEQSEPTKEQLLGYLERAGWGPCNIPACNCNGWHQVRASRSELELQEKISDLSQKVHAARGLLSPLGDQATPSVLAIREAIAILR